MMAKNFTTINWGAASALARGPIIAGMNAGDARNAIGVHAGGFAVYQGLAVAVGDLSGDHLPDLSNTQPSALIGPFPQWSAPGKIVSFDPWGHLVAQVFCKQRAEGLDIRPSIAITDGHLRMPEISDAMRCSRLKPDGRILKLSGDISVTKIAIEPVWWLPGIAERLQVTETRLRESILQCTAGMYPALIDDMDCKVFLPPIGGSSIYIFGDVAKLGDPGAGIACRIHDECSGSDVFGSTICTCRPYLAFGVEECVRMAQQGGIGVIVYNRKEGRALGEVVKLLVYNSRARAPTGDHADAYFDRTQAVAGVEDLRFQALSADALHWLGITRVDRWISMSHLKANAVIEAGIEIALQVELPEEIIPSGAQVEIAAKKASGYFVGQATHVPEQISPLAVTAR